MIFDLVQKLIKQSGTVGNRSRKRAAQHAFPIAADVLEVRSLLSATLPNFLTAEHVDLNTSYNSGTGAWSIQPRNSDESPAVSYNPDDVVLYVGSRAQTVRPASGDFAFVGVNGGETFYRLPQSQDPNLLYMGVSSYGVTSSFVDRYNPLTESKGRISGSGRWVKNSLVNVQHFNPDGTVGTGTFSIWQNGDTGPIVMMSSYNDGVTNPNASGLDTTDGISSNDALWIVAGGHIHYEFGFSQPGRYEITLKASGYFGDNGNSSTPNLAGYSESQPIKLYFSVTNVGQLEFDSSTYTVDEDAGTASILVRRVNGSDARLTVDYSTSNGTALAGSDYGATAGTLTFEDQEVEKYITIPIIDDVLTESDETVLLSLSNPGPPSIANYVIDPARDNRSLLGANSSAVLTIRDQETSSTNEAPTLAGASTLNYLANQAATVINSVVVVGDVDNTTLAFATISVSANYLSSEDVLEFVGTAATGNITGSFNPTTGTLTLTSAGSTATVSQFQAALRLVTYRNTNGNPSLLSRSIAYQVSDGSNLSNVLTSTVNVALPNQAPTLAGASTLNYLANQAATVINSVVVVSDVDNTTLSSATVQVSANYLSSEDVLGFVGTAATGNITGSFNSTTGVLTLTSAGSTATVGEFQSALRLVTYRNTNGNPSLLPRSIAYQVSDGSDLSNILTSTVNVALPNQAPTLAGSSTLNYLANQAATAINSVVVVSDVDNTTLSSATVQVSANYLSSEDVLGFVGTAATGNITGSFNSTTGVLTLTSAGSTATVSQFRSALRLVTYRNTNGNPSLLSRSIAYQVSDGSDLSNVLTSTVNVALPNQEPSSATLSNFLTAEHVDINTSYNPTTGAWNIQPTNADESPAVSYNPDDVLLYVGSPAETVRPASSNFAFVGVDGGETFYKLPQSQDPNLLYMGMASYGVTAAYVDRYNPLTESKGRISGSGRWLKNSLVNVQHFNPDGSVGTGSFSVWQNGDTGPIVLMSSYNDGVANPNANGLDTTDGITSDDAIWLIAGGHTHFEYGFSQPGRYEITLKASAYIGDNGVNGNQNTANLAGYSESQPIKLYFSAMNVGQLEFDSSTYTVDEDAGTASILVRRVNGGDGRLTVDYSTSNGTALAGSDYVATVGTLTFEDREVEKYITIPIIDDDLTEPDETVLLSLSNPGPSSIANYVIDPARDNRSLLGANSSATLTIRGQEVSSPNDAPTLAGTSSLIYKERQAAANVNTVLAVGDLDNATLSSATVQISANYIAGEDVLEFVGATTTGNITGSFDPVSGTLTLQSAGSTATLAQFQAALRLVKYSNASFNPTSAVRTVSYQVSDGTLSSNVMTSLITVVPANNAPTVSGTSVLAYTEKGAAQVINPSIVVADVDNALVSATVRISANNSATQDFLGFVGDATTGNITGSFSGGFLTLISPGGTATVAQFQAALRRVTYVNTSANPSTLPRSVTYQVSDGTILSTAVTSTINITAVNDAPTLVGASTLIYTPNQVATAVNKTVVVADADNTTLSSATVRISSNYVAAEDRLGFVGTTTTGNIVGSFNAATGTMTLTSVGATATIAQFMAAIRLVTYQNISATPTNAPRSIQYQVFDPTVGSNLVTSLVTMKGTGTAPVVGGQATTLSYSEKQAATVVNSTVTVNDADSTTLAWATVRISANLKATEDVLDFVGNASTGNITGTYSPSTGTLTLISEGALATAAQFEAALRLVTYRNGSANPSLLSRSIAYQLSDGSNLSNILTSTVTINS